MWADPPRARTRLQTFSPPCPLAGTAASNMSWVRVAWEGGIPTVEVQGLCGRDAGRILVLGMRHLDGEVGPFSICSKALLLIPRPPRPVDLPSQPCLWTGRGAG